MPSKRFGDDDEFDDGEEDFDFDFDECVSCASGIYSSLCREDIQEDLVDDEDGDAPSAKRLKVEDEIGPSSLFFCH